MIFLVGGLLSDYYAISRGTGKFLTVNVKGIYDVTTLFCSCVALLDAIYFFVDVVL